MGRANRKKWLLLLWEYHNGGLRDAEIGVVDRRVAEDLKSRTDSERVLGIINELRQEGRWETHPEFPSQSIDPDDQVELAGLGAMMERAFTTPYTGKVSWEDIFEATRVVGPGKTVWATDLGQDANPPVEDGLALMADEFLAAGATGAASRHLPPFDRPATLTV